MLNYLWAAMVIIGVAYGGINGTMNAVGEGILISAKEAVNLCITMLGVLTLWMGMMNVAKESGLIRKLTKILNPFLSFLFPGIGKETKAREYIATNIIANILGLGWAATPAGLKAMEELRIINNEKCKKSGKSPFTASNEMCIFLIINISSLQLIPVNIIAYRSQYGSVNPTAIILPGIIATFISTMTAIIFCKLMDGRKNR